MQKPIIQNDRDQRVYEWLCEQVGEAAVSEACQSLAGNRHPYLSNIAKNLGLVVPADLAKTPRREAQARLAQIIKNLDDKISK